MPAQGARTAHEVLPVQGDSPYWIGRCACGWETALYRQAEEATLEVRRHVDDARRRPD